MTPEQLAFRYRRQVAPFGVAVTLLIAGAMAYEASNGLRVMLAASALSVLVVALAGPRVLDRPIERRYALVLIVSCSLWTCLVAARGVSSALLLALLVGTLVLGIPWWVHVRVRRGDRRPTSTASSEAATVWQEHVAGPGQALPGAQLTGVRPAGKGGWTGTIVLPRGQKTTADAIAATGGVTSAYELPVGAVAIERTPDGVASHARITVMPDNPLQAGAVFTGPSLDRETGIAEIGVHMDGAPAQFAFWAPGSGAVHTLVAGTTGSGKSRFLEQILAEARHSGLITTWLIDPQGGQSLPRWIDRVDWSARSAEDGLVLIDAAVAVMRARSRHLARKTWTDHKGRTITGVDHFEPTPQMPLLQLVIEEAPDLLRAYPDAVDKLASIGKMGRKCGVGAVLAAQKPSVDELGGSSTLRAMASSGNIVCFRTSDKVSAGMAFAGSLPGDPSAIPKYFPNGKNTGGMGYIAGPGSRAAVMRAYWVDDPYEWAHSGTPAALDALSAKAAGLDYDNRPRPDVDEGQEESAPTVNEGDDDKPAGRHLELVDDEPADIDAALPWETHAAPDYDDPAEVAGAAGAGKDETRRERPQATALTSSTCPDDDGPDERSATAKGSSLVVVDEAPPADIDDAADLPAGMDAPAVIEAVLRDLGAPGEELRTYQILEALQSQEREEYRYKPSEIATAMKGLEGAGVVRRLRPGFWTRTGGDLR